MEAKLNFLFKPWTASMFILGNGPNISFVNTLRSSSSFVSIFLFKVFLSCWSLNYDEKQINTG